MSREHQSGTDSAAAGRADDRAALAPGKSTLTAGGGEPDAGGEASTRARAIGTGSLPRLDLDGGQPLPDAQRARFETSLGTDLSGVRVHTGETAGKAATSVDARAYAVGQDIAFGPGQYKPGTPAGDKLLAHEVAHTVQQSGASSGGALQTTQPGDAVEQQADGAAGAMVAGRPAEVSSAPLAIARKRMDEDDGPSDPPPGGDAPGAGPPADGAPMKEGDPKPEKEKEEEIGELSAERVGQEEEEGTEPISPIPDTEGGKADIQSKGQQLSAEGSEAAGTPVPAVEPPPAAGAGGGEVPISAELQESITQAQGDAQAATAEAKAEAEAFKAEMAARRDRFDAQQSALTLEQLKSMSPADKRATLVEMGMDQKSVKKMKDAELDGIISGRIETEQRKTKILGMDPEQLAGLSPGQKAQFLVDLGIDKKDVDKIGPDKAARAFDDIMRVAHVPGQHKVKIKVKGGLLGKSWEVSVKVDAEGNPELEAKKKGGFLSKLWGWVKLALPVIALVLAPITAGASLIALAVYQTVTAIASGDWLGAIIGAAGAMVGLGAIAGIGRTAQGAATAFGKIADVAGKVQKVAQAAQGAMAAAKAKNAGSLLAALSEGAGAFASFASDQMGKFAKTMRRWSEKLDTWGKVIAGGEAVVKGVKTGNVGAALGGAFDAVAAMFSKKNADGEETSTNAKRFERYSRMAKFVAAGQAAAKADPPSFGSIIDAAMGMAGELNLFKKDGEAAKITAAATRLGVAIASKDPQAISAAALGLAESIQLAKLPGDENDAGNADDKKTIVDRYARANRVVKIAAQAIKAASKKPRPDYASALDAAAQMVAEFTQDKRLDQAAKITAAMDRWTKAIQSKDDRAIIEAGFAFGESVYGLRAAIHEQRDKSRAAAQAQLEPGEPLPEGEAGDVPSFDPGAPELLPSTPIGGELVGLPPAVDPSSPIVLGTSPSSRSNTPDANYTVIERDTLSGIAQRFKTSVAILRELNSQLVGDTIYVGQRLNVPGGDVKLPTNVTTSETFEIDGMVFAENNRAAVIANARRFYEKTIKPEIARFLGEGGHSLGGTFKGEVQEFQRQTARLGTYLERPDGIGTNVFLREIAHVNQEYIKFQRKFDYWNGGYLSTVEATRKAAEFTKSGASVILGIFDRTGFIKAGYEAAVTAIDAYAAGSHPLVAVGRGAIQGMLEKIPLIKDAHGMGVVTNSINEAYKQVGETISDVFVYASKKPPPTSAQLREYAGRRVASAAFVSVLAPIKGLGMDVDTRTTNNDLPGLVEAVCFTLAETAEALVEEIVKKDMDDD